MVNSEQPNVVFTILKKQFAGCPAVRTNKIVGSYYKGIRR